VGFTTGHGMTVQIPVQASTNGGLNYTFSVEAIRPGSWPWPARTSHAGYTSTVYVAAQPWATIAIVTPVTPPVPATTTETLNYNVAVTGNTPVTTIETFANGVLQTNELSVGPNAANVGSQALTFGVTAPNAPTVETLVVELLDGTQVVATSAPAYVTLPTHS
jgi:hypothetical protein